MITKLQGKALDKFETIAANATFKRAIMGDTLTGEYTLYDVDELAEGKTLTEKGVALIGRGLCFCGVLGIVDGRPVSALEDPLDKTIIDKLSAAFAAEFDAHASIEVREQVEQVVFAGWVKHAAQA